MKNHTTTERGYFAIRPVKRAWVNAVCIIVFTLAAVHPVLAEQVATKPEQIINIRNAGAFLCTDVLPAVSEPGREIEKTAFLQWASAYATAAARSNGLIDVFPIGDTAELVRMTTLVCSENMAENFEAALRTAIGRLRAYWIKASAEVLVLNDPNGRTVQFYAESVPQLQRDLQSIGLGLVVDGKYDNQTGNAIRAMNEARGATQWLTPDGQILYILTLPEK